MKRERRKDLTRREWEQITSWRPVVRRIPKEGLPRPGSEDQGAPLSAPSDERYEFVQVGRRADNGWPIVERRPKPWPTR